MDVCINVHGKIIAGVKAEFRVNDAHSEFLYVVHVKIVEHVLNQFL